MGAMGMFPNCSTSHAIFIQFKLVGLGDSLGGFAGLGGRLDRGLGRHDGIT